MKHTIEFYTSRKQWYWRMRSIRNQKIVADGAEGYATKSNVKRAIAVINYGRLKVIEVES